MASKAIQWKLEFELCWAALPPCWELGRQTGRLVQTPASWGPSVMLSAPSRHCSRGAFEVPEVPSLSRRGLINVISREPGEVPQQLPQRWPPAGLGSTPQSGEINDMAGDWLYGPVMITHYSDVTMSALASLITDISPTVCSTICWDLHQRKHQSSASLAFVSDGFPSQRASNAENVSIWWRHDDNEIQQGSQWRQT